MFSIESIDASRRQRALSGELTPIQAESTDMEFCFLGSDGGKYATTLDSCTCMDFAMTGGATPCKHMIRMAMEKGLIPGDGMITDTEAANQRYYKGILNSYVRTAAPADAVRVVQILDDPSAVGDDGLAFAGVPSIQALGFFVPKGKKQTLTPTKKAVKEIDEIRKHMFIALGAALYARLSDPRAADLIRSFSE